MSRRHHLSALLACAALLPLLPATAVAASASRQQRWAVTRVSLEGTFRSTLDDDARYAYAGRFEYLSGTDAGTLDLTPRPGRLYGAVIGPVQYAGSSVASIATTDRRFDCGLQTPDGFAPERLAGGVSFDRTRMKVQWSIVPPPMRCPDGAPTWSFPGLPAEVTTQQYSLADLRKVKAGKSLRLGIDIRRSWKNDGGRHEANVAGYVRLRRLG